MNRKPGALWLALAAASAAFAGGGPQNVLLVVNDRSIESQELAHYYRDLRGIPERNLCHVAVEPLTVDLPTDAFQTSVVDRISEHIAAHGLSNQIDFVVLCKDLPSRVNDNEGATAVLFYGFKNAPLIVSDCSMPANTRSAYYKAERAFRRGAGGGTNGCLAFMITAADLSQTLSNVWRGAAADGTQPGGEFFLLEPPGDQARNVRYRLFDNFDFHARFVSNFPAYAFIADNVTVGRTNVLGYLTGVPAYPEWVYSTNRFLNGGMADHFTSYGGRLPVPPAGQDPVWKWIAAGATASYGTVNEPCAYLEKFPDPLCYYWYARGFSLGESYAMSVANPYQGLFAGEPLAAPYARPGSVAITNFVTNQVVSGTVTAALHAAAAAADRPCGFLEIHVDDLYAGTVTSAPPAAGNRIALAINATTCSYTVAAGDTLYDVVTGVAACVNAAGLPVQASAFGDRLLLVYTNRGQAGAWLGYGVSTESGAAAELTLRAQALSTNLLESVYVAREYIALSGTAQTGDTVTCVITLTNSLAITNHIVAAQDESAESVLGRLQQAVNADPALQGADGALVNLHGWYAISPAVLEARTAGPAGANLHVDYTIARAVPGSGLNTNDSFSDFFNDNIGDLTARGAVLVQAGRDTLDGAWNWDTTGLPNGLHALRAVVREGAGPETQGHFVLPLIVSNSAFAVSLSAPTNGEAFVLGDDLAAEASPTHAAGTVTQIVFVIEGKRAAADSAPPFTCSAGTTNYGVGNVSIRAWAFDSAGGQSLSDPVTVSILRSPTLDTDGDGIADSWEQRYFGGLYVYGASSDPDGDRGDNRYEFDADTDPSDAASEFALSPHPLAAGVMNVSFLSSTNRLYAPEFNDGAAPDLAGWQSATGTPFLGSGSVTNWLDDGHETGIHPSLVTQRIYRMKASPP